MRWLFEFKKKEIVIDESQIVKDSKQTNTHRHIVDIMRGSCGGWLMYTGAFGETTYINLKKCTRIMEKKA